MTHCETYTALYPSLILPLQETLALLNLFLYEAVIGFWVFISLFVFKAGSFYITLHGLEPTMTVDLRDPPASNLQVLGLKT